MAQSLSHGRVAGIELGGTKVLVAAGWGLQAEGPPGRLSTGAPAETLAEVVDILQALQQQGRPFEAIGVASFGPLSLDRGEEDYGRLLNTPKPGWAGVSLIAPLRAIFDGPIIVETDVNAAAIAEELQDGGARSDHAYITVGTGVGVGLVVNGRPAHGAGHPEAGHLLIRPAPGDAFPGVCFAHGACLEGMISGPALAARLGRPMQAAEPDPAVWDLIGDYLAQLGIALVLTTAPQRIVLGGGIGARPELLQATRRALHRHLGGYLDRYADPSSMEHLLVPAVLEHSGLIGALHLATTAVRTSLLQANS